MPIQPARSSLAVLMAVVMLLGPSRSLSAQPAKSPGKAALLSILLPGTGELYAGGGRSSRFFLFIEGTFWTGLITFQFLESTRIDTYRSFAAAHAGAQLKGKSESYIEEVFRFQSIYARNAREIFLAGDLADLRPETSDQRWEWDSDTSRLKFQDLRSKAVSAEQKAFLFVGALVFNRFVSALNAASIARRSRPAGNLKLGVFAPPGGGLKTWLQASF
jgi:hypothetical protein